MRKIDLIKKIEAEHKTGQWQKAVEKYAIEIINAIDEKESYANITEKELLNGAKDWKEYSEGGTSLIYNEDIAERVCTPSEYKKTKGGKRNPNVTENWLDVQARALYQASKIIVENAKA